MEEIGGLTAKILNKLNNVTLDKLAGTLPTTLTTDAHILKAKESFSEGETWDAFHHLSLTHSTLMYHRLSHKQYRPHNFQKTNLDPGLDEKKKESSSPSPTPPKDLPTATEDLRPSSMDKTKQLLQLLPADWTVVQITSESRMCGDKKSWKRIDEPLHTPTLYISRCRCGTSPSVLIRRVSPPKDEGSVRDILQELELIKGENKVISKYYVNDQEKYLCKREEVNNRLKVLVQSIENGWLRYFSCLLFGSLHPSLEMELDKKVREAARRSKVSLSQDQISLLMLMCSHPLGSSTFDFPLRAGVASVLKESARSTTVKALTSAILEVRDQLKDSLAAPRNPVILIIDKAVVSLPWEMTSALQGQSVTRMPSLHSLVHLYMHHSRNPSSLLTKGVDASNGFFLLDPEGNLPRSQERLQETFALTGWQGMRGTKPTHDQFKDALSSNDVFVYVGHGSGSQYMPAQLVETVECRALVLLYGCSSASLSRRGNVPDPWGVILNYFIASCPCVVGMLWEVMDKDTDLLTKEMVRALRGVKGSQGAPLEDPPSDVPLLVAKARPLCSWYLISAALVVYGLPLQVVPQ